MLSCVIMAKKKKKSNGKMMTYKTKTYLLQEKPEDTQVVKDKKLKEQLQDPIRK